MRIRTPADLGALIRDHRTRLGLDQKSLAQKVGVSRQWIVDSKKGGKRGPKSACCSAPSVALGITLDAEKEGPGKPKGQPACLTVRMHTSILISIVASARRKRK